MSKMTLKRFEKYCAIYGSNLHQWPDCDADDIRRYMADEPRALECYLDAQSLDMQLDDFAVPEASTDIILAAKAQILRDKANHADAAAPQYKIRFGKGGGFWARPAYAFAATFCFALVMFFSFYPSTQDQTALPTEAVQPMQLASLDDALADIEALAEAADEREDILSVFAEVEQERQVEKFIDGLAYEYDDTITDAVWDYFHQQG